MSNFLHWIIIFANIVAGVSFLLATASVSRTDMPGFLWQTVLLRLITVIVYFCVSYDFFRQAYFIIFTDDVFIGNISPLYTISRIVLAVSLPVGLWILRRIKSNRIINPAVESYVEKMIREVEEEEARRRAYDKQLGDEAGRREAFNNTVVDEAPRREEYDLEAGREEARRDTFDEAHKH